VSLSAARLVVMVDSMVAVGEISKGRSSSFVVNGLIRELLGSLVLGQQSLALLWVPTDVNIADNPSRFVPLRDRCAVPPWRCPGLIRGLSHIGGHRAPPHRSRLCLEIFAGSVGLSHHLCLVGLTVGRPWEPYSEGGGFIHTLDIMNDFNYMRLVEDIRNHCYNYIHFGINCKTLGPAGSRNGRTRTIASPYGSEEPER
jgi:hypothetical protein